jgi:hypothetical protein
VNCLGQGPGPHPRGGGGGDDGGDWAEGMSISDVCMVELVMVVGVRLYPYALTPRRML